MKKSSKTISVFRSVEGKNIVRKRYEEIINNPPVPCNSRIVNGTHLLECGNEKASPLLLLHGTLSNSAAWFGDIGTWSKEFRVIAADIPGEPGLSSEYRLSPSGNDFVLWLEGLMESLGYGNTAVSIIGQSLGAFVALKYAVQHPDLVKNISMLTVSGIAPARAGFIFKALPLMLLGKKGAGRINKMIEYGVDTGPEAAEFGALVSKYCRPLTVPIPVFSDEELARLGMPVQYFGGDHDVLLDTDATATRLTKLVPETEIHILKETGHVIIGQTGKIMEFLMKQVRNDNIT